MGSVFFHAPSLFPGPNRPLLTWIYQPEFCGVLIAHADDDYILMTAYLHEAQAIAADSGTYWSKALPKVIGSMDDVTVRSYGTWEMTSQLADSFRAGRLLFIGDAAHRFPHTGGFGLNSGVQDAQNVAWKLAAVLSGQAEPALMDTYEAERRPVITRFAEQSVSNHFLLDTVTKPVGVTNRSLHHATEALARAPFTWVPGSLMARVCTGLTTIQCAARLCWPKPVGALSGSPPRCEQPFPSSSSTSRRPDWSSDTPTPARWSRRSDLPNPASATEWWTTCQPHGQVHASRTRSSAPVRWRGRCAMP